MRKYRIDGLTPQGSAARDQQAFRLGLDFHETAIRAAKQERNPMGAPIVPLCPMITCYAFAAELYLKSMLPAATKNHRLNVLFGHLHPDIQAEVFEHYRTRTSRDLRTMDEDLRALATAFVDWRYIFEGEGQQLHVNLLIAFTRAVFEAVRMRRPDWSVHPYDDARLLAEEDEPSLTVANLGGGVFVHALDATGGGLT